MPNADGSLTPEEELEAQFKPEGGQDEEAARLAAAKAAEDAAAPPTPKVKIGDAEYDEAEVRSLLEFQDWAKEHQKEMSAFSDYLRGDAEFTPKQLEQQQQQQDPADPFAAISDEKTREFLKQQHDEIEQLRDVTTRQVTASSLAEADRAVNIAYEHVKQQFGLDEESVQSLANATAASGILPGIRANEPDASKAAIKALEMTYWATPEFRDKAIELEITRLSEHERRKGLAGSLGGSSGSLDRTVPSDEEVAKMSKQERISAMAQEIAASQRGTV